MQPLIYYNCLSFTSLLNSKYTMMMNYSGSISPTIAAAKVAAPPPLVHGDGIGRAHCQMSNSYSLDIQNCPRVKLSLKLAAMWRHHIKNSDSRFHDCSVVALFKLFGICSKAGPKKYTSSASSITLFHEKVRRFLSVPSNCTVNPSLALYKSDS